MDNLQKYPVYFDPRVNKLYYITWYDTGNNEIATKHYINIESPDRIAGVSSSIAKKCKISVSE